MRIFVRRLVIRSSRSVISIPSQPSSLSLLNIYSNYCRCWMMITTMVIGMTMVSRITNAFPPNVRPKSMLTYSSLRRPLCTSKSLLVQQRGGGGRLNSNTNRNAVVSNTASSAFIKRTRGRSVINQMSTATDVLVDDVSNTAPLDTSTSNNDSNISLLRALMKERNIDIYLIPSDDPHLSGKLFLLV